MDEPWRACIEEEAVGAELRAAHAREYIPDDVPASIPVQWALKAAASDGFALGLRRALELVDSMKG